MVCRSNCTNDFDGFAYVVIVFDQNQTVCRSGGMNKHSGKEAAGAKTASDGILLQS